MCLSHKHFTKQLGLAYISRLIDIEDEISEDDLVQYNTFKIGGEYLKLYLMTTSQGFNGLTGTDLPALGCFA